MATTWVAQVWFGFGCVTFAVGYWCLRQANKLLGRAHELNRDTREAQDEMTERHRLLMGLFLTVHTPSAQAKERWKEAN